MIPSYFGPTERRLFGLFHPAARDASRPAVLLCNPFGQEAVRIHRFYRVLAERLSRNGIAVLRFDYYGTNDSAGDDDEGDLVGWADDILRAQAELRLRSGASRTRWMGARLGASLALQAASRLGDDPQTAPERLVLWDPVLDGAAYSQLLRVKHVEALETAYDVPDPALRRRLARDPAAFRDEAMGFGVSPLWRQQLEALRPDATALPATTQLRVVADPGDAVVERWIAGTQAAGRALESTPLTHAFDWTSEHALNAALVPGAALQQLLASLA